MSNELRHFYEFACFRLEAAERLLLRQGEEVELSPKPFETLLVLVRNSGRLVSKEELIKSVWPDTNVEEGNLTLAVHNLRKARRTAAMARNTSKPFPATATDSWPKSKKDGKGKPPGGVLTRVNFDQASTNPKTAVLQVTGRGGAPQCRRLWRCSRSQRFFSIVRTSARRLSRTRLWYSLF